MSDTQASAVYAFVGWVFVVFLAAAVLAIARVIFRRVRSREVKRKIGNVAKLLVVLGTVGLYSLVPAPVFAQAAGYPGGTRNLSEWYYCYSSRQHTNGTWTVWSDMPCEHLLWNDTPGTYHSQWFEFGLLEGFTAVNQGAEIVGYIIPPEHIKKYFYHCEGTVSRAFASGISGSSNGTVSSHSTTSNPFNADGTAFSFGYPSNIAANSTFANSFNVNGSMRASQNDNFVTLEPVTGWSAANAESTYPHFKTAAGVDTVNRQIVTFMKCYINGLEMWSGSPWTPDIGDLIPDPSTPTPGPGDWITDPWVPITSTVNAPRFEVTEPISETCTTVVPGIQVDDSAATGGGSWWDWVIGAIPVPDVNTTPVEFCIAEWGLDLWVFGYDVSGALVTMMALSAAGVLFSILKSP